MSELICRISVIIPAYNVEFFIRRCLSSVLEQTFIDFEVIVVDDGSKDRTGAIIKEYQQQDTRVIGVFKENGGVTSARNAGVALARGEYLFFLDGDDYVPRTALSDLYRQIEEDHSDIVFGLFALDENGKRHVYRVDDFGRVSQIEYLKLLMTGKAPWQLWSKLIKRDLFLRGKIELPADLAVGEDALTLFQLTLKARSVSMVNHTVYYYVQRGDSVMHVVSPKLANDNLRAANLIVECIERKGLSSELLLHILALRLLFLLMAFQRAKLQVCRDYVQTIVLQYKEHKEVMELFKFSKRLKIRMVLNVYKWFLK